MGFISQLKSRLPQDALPNLRIWLRGPPVCSYSALF